jgi:hypothetical protein
VKQERRDLVEDSRCFQLGHIVTGRNRGSVDSPPPTGSSAGVGDRRRAPAPGHHCDYGFAIEFGRAPRSRAVFGSRARPWPARGGRDSRPFAPRGAGERRSPCSRVRRPARRMTSSSRSLMPAGAAGVVFSCRTRARRHRRLRDARPPRRHARRLVRALPRTPSGLAPRARGRPVRTRQPPCPYGEWLSAWTT